MMTKLERSFRLQEVVVLFKTQQKVVCSTADVSDWHCRRHREWIWCILWFWVEIAYTIIPHNIPRSMAIIICYQINQIQVIIYITHPLPSQLLIQTKVN